jgi:hypothetical protein
MRVPRGAVHDPAQRPDRVGAFPLSMGCCTAHGSISREPADISATSAGVIVPPPVSPSDEQPPAATASFATSADSRPRSGPNRSTSIHAAFSSSSLACRLRARNRLHFIAWSGVTSLHSTIAPTSAIILSSFPARQPSARSTSVASSLGACTYRSTSERLLSFTNDSALSTITSLCPLISPNERHSSRMSAASSFSPSNRKVSTPPIASASFSLNPVVCWRAGTPPCP